MAILERNDRGAIAYIRLNSPDRLNALSEALLSALEREFLALMDDRTIRVVILSGAGKAFCAGHDLSEMQLARQSDDGGTEYFKKLFARCGKIMQMIPRLPQPVIARVHGIATAAGCQLVATCDMAVADTDTRFGVNGINIGLFCSTPMVPLSRNVPRKQAFEMLTTGEFIPAARALEIGLVNRVVPAAELEQTTDDLARKVADKLGSAIGVGKRAFYEQAQMPLEQAYDLAARVMAENMVHPDTVEGTTAFLEKRDPNWRQ